VVQTELQRRLEGVRIADVMDPEPVAIPGDATVAQALEEYFLRYRWPWFPVVDAGRSFVGLLNRGTADSVPETSRDSRTVSDLLGEEAGPGSERDDQHVRSDEPIESLLANIELRRLGGLAAVDADGKLIGVVTLEQVGRALRGAVGTGVAPIEDDPRPPSAP